MSKRKSKKTKISGLPPKQNAPKPIPGKIPSSVLSSKVRRRIYWGIIVTTLTLLCGILGFFSNIIQITEWWRNKSPSSSLTASWYFTKGVEAFDKIQPDFEEAEECFLKARNADKYLKAANYYLAVIRSRQDRIEESLDLLKEVPRDDPKYVDVLRLMVLLYSEKQDNQNLEKTVSDLLERDPVNIVGRLILTQLLGEQQDLIRLNIECRKNIDMFSKMTEGLLEIDRESGLFKRKIYGLEKGVDLAKFEIPDMFYTQMLLFVSCVHLWKIESLIGDDRVAFSYLERAMSIPLPIKKPEITKEIDAPNRIILHIGSADVAVSSLIQEMGKIGESRLVQMEIMEEGEHYTYFFRPLKEETGISFDIGMMGFYLSRSYIRNLIHEYQKIMRSQTEGK